MSNTADVSTAQGRLLRLRDWSLLLTSVLTVMAGATIAPSLPSMGEHFSNVPRAEFLVKLVLTIPALIIALSATLLGFLTDRIGKRRVLIISSLIFALAGSAGLLIDSLTGILISRAILGLAVAGIMTSMTALIAGYFSGDERTRFLGYQSATSAFGGMVFLLAGGLLADLNWRMPFLVYALGLPIAILSILALPKCSANAPQTLPLTKEIKKTDDWKAVSIVCLIGFLGMVAFYLVPTVLPFHLESAFQATATQSGAAIGCSTFAGGIFALLNRRIKKSFTFAGAIILTFILMGVAYTLVAVSAHYWLILVAMFLSGSGLGLLFPNLNSKILSSVDITSSGRAAGFLTTSIFTGQFLSPVLTEPLQNRFDSGAVFGTFGITMISLSLLAVAWPNLKLCAD